jgi:hypothetical protein
VSKPKSAIAISVGIALVVLARWVHAELPQMRIVAATGVPLPDGTLASPVRFSTAVDGDTAYLAGPTASELVLVHEIDKRPHVVLRAGDPSPSGSGTVYEFGRFAMTPARLLFHVETSNHGPLLLTHDDSGIHSVFEQWIPDLDLDLRQFELIDSNVRGDALLSHHPMYEGVHGFTLVLNGPGGVGDPIAVVRDGDPIPGVAGSVFDLAGSWAYLADDGQVVFDSDYAGGTVPGVGVFFMPGGSSATTDIEQVMVPFPGELIGTEICCNLAGADDDGVIGIIGRREAGETYLFVGKPPELSLALTVPFEGLAVPNAPEYRLPQLYMYQEVVGRGGAFLWVGQLDPAEVTGPGGFAVLTHEPDVGLRAIAIEGTPAPGGGSFPHYLTSLAANGRGGFLFSANQTVYRSSRTDDVITLERLAGPTDRFEGPDGAMVTVQEADSNLDSRAFEAGRVALTLDYSNPKTGTSSTMIVVDGEPLPEPPESCACRTVVDGRAGGGPAGLTPIALLGLSLLGRSRRRASRLSCSTANS